MSAAVRRSSHQCRNRRPAPYHVPVCPLVQENEDIALHGGRSLSPGHSPQQNPLCEGATPRDERTLLQQSVLYVESPLLGQISTREATLLRQASSPHQYPSLSQELEPSADGPQHEETPLPHADIRQEYPIGEEFPPPQVFLRAQVDEENLVHQVSHQIRGNSLLPGEVILLEENSPLPARVLPHRVSLLEDGSSRSAEALRSPTQTSMQEQFPSSTLENLYQLVVRPIIKSTIGQRDTSGKTLDDFVVNGVTFSAILQKRWDQYSPRVKCKAIKTDEIWSTEQPAVDEWSKVMQFKVKKHVVETTKSEHAWNRWLVKTRGKTAILLIYEYGVAITRAQDLHAFKSACIIPEHTDRAGTTAEVSLRDIVASLQEEWESTFRGEAVVWRMWGNTSPETLTDPPGKHL